MLDNDTSGNTSDERFKGKRATVKRATIIVFDRKDTLLNYTLVKYV